MSHFPPDLVEAMRPEDEEMRYEWENRVGKLLDKDYKLLGAGCFGMVYAMRKESEKVFKVYVRDSGYRVFLDLAMELQGKNPHVPVIYERIDFKESSVVVVMERLHGTVDEYDAESKVRIAQGMARLYLKGEIRQRPEFLGSHFAELLDQLKALLEEQRLAPDLHSRNMMLRMDDTVVITDPFS